MPLNGPCPERESSCSHCAASLALEGQDTSASTRLAHREVEAGRSWTGKAASDAGATCLRRFCPSPEGVPVGSLSVPNQHPAHILENSR